MQAELPAQQVDDRYNDYWGRDMQSKHASIHRILIIFGNFPQEESSMTCYPKGMYSFWPDPVQYVPTKHFLHTEKLTAPASIHGRANVYVNSLDVGQHLDRFQTKISLEHAMTGKINFFALHVLRKTIQCGASSGSQLSICFSLNIWLFFHCLSVPKPNFSPKILRVEYAYI